MVEVVSSLTNIAVLSISAVSRDITPFFQLIYMCEDWIFSICCESDVVR